MESLEEAEEIQVSRWAAYVGRGFASVAAVALVIPLVLLVANAIMRIGSWGTIPYLYEISGYATAVLGALSFAYASSGGGNVSTTILTSRLRGRVKSVVLQIGLLITIVTAGVTAYALTLRALSSFEVKEQHFGAEWMLIWPARMALAVGIWVVALIVIDQFIRLVRQPITEVSEA